MTMFEVCILWKRISSYIHALTSYQVANILFYGNILRAYTSAHLWIKLYLKSELEN
jgi:hypothetical protein